MGSLSGIPTVDPSSFFDGSGQAARQRVADELAQACHASGCVGIIGHGITDDLLQQGFATARKLFDLPMDQKMLAPHPNGAVPHRGYSAVGKEKAFTKEDLQQGEHYRDTLRKIVDCKETYEVGSESNEVQYNIWLPEAVLPGFRTFSTKLYWELHRTSMRILDAMIMALNLSDSEGEYVRSLHSGHGNQLRFSHYPPVPIDKLNKEILSRLPAHTDWRSV
ncbi:MAG: hypothetical protein LQ348_002542 [Seirophora lacunosa]|nr:MAG: hypothetical protein LQ348_002542 [Seirophora lacunosa]